MTALICASLVPPDRVSLAIEMNETTVATGVPCILSESRMLCSGAESFALYENDTSPPIKSRACARIDCCTLLAKLSIATSAATPSEIDDMYRSSRRRAVRLSRHARPETFRQRFAGRFTAPAG